MSQMGGTFVASVPAVPVGSMQAFAGSSAPTGWLLCNGTTASRTTYSNLYSVIGTTYGVGDGSTTFGLPDMRGRVPMGAGTGNQQGGTGSGVITGGTSLAARTAGQFGGDERLQDHNHQLGGILAQSVPVTSPTNYVASYSSGGAESRFTSNVNSGGLGGTPGTGGNMPPFVVLNYVIKAIPDTPRGGMTATYTPPIVTSLPLVPQFGDQVVHLQTVAGTTYSTLKQWDGTAWVAVGPQPATTWVSPTLNSPWTNYGGGWQPARYTRDAMGTVFVEGLVNSGLVGSAVFNLPAGFRPAQGLIFSTVANNTFARLDIGSNGDVVWNTGGTSGFVSISCNFKASQ